MLIIIIIVIYIAFKQAKNNFAYCMFLLSLQCFTNIPQYCYSDRV